MKNISVFVITYNQEAVIKRLLDSILVQKEWGLQHIIIGDDASTDGTYSIITDYCNKYPGVIKAIRNATNLGIYENLQNVVDHKDDSDLFLFIAGDDELCDGYFEALQEFVAQNNIDVTKPIGIFSDWITETPSSRKTLNKQDIVIGNNGIWSLYLRGKVSIRSSVISKKVIDAYKPVDFSHGLLFAESMFDAQPYHLFKEVYYLPYVASVYYAGVGVSAKLNPRISDYYTKQWRYKWEYYLDHFIDTKEDTYYAKYELKKAEFYENPTFGKYFIMYWYHQKGKLPHSNNTIKSDFMRFGALFKYLIKYYGKPVIYK